MVVATANATYSLNENKISDEGAVELAEGLKLNRGLKELRLNPARQYPHCINHECWSYVH
jgi:hypothetical protein